MKEGVSPETALPALKRVLRPLILSASWPIGRPHLCALARHGCTWHPLSKQQENFFRRAIFHFCLFR